MLRIEEEKKVMKNFAHFLHDFNHMFLAKIQQSSFIKRTFTEYNIIHNRLYETVAIEAVSAFLIKIQQTFRIHNSRNISPNFAPLNNKCKTKSAQELFLYFAYKKIYENYLYSRISFPDKGFLFAHFMQNKGTKTRFLLV